MGGGNPVSNVSKWASDRTGIGGRSLQTLVADAYGGTAGAAIQLGGRVTEDMQNQKRRAGQAAKGAVIDTDNAINAMKKRKQMEIEAAALSAARRQFRPTGGPGKEIPASGGTLLGGAPTAGNGNLRKTLLGT